MDSDKSKFEQDFYENLLKDMRKPRIKWFNVFYICCAITGLAILITFTSMYRLFEFLRYNSITIGIVLITISIYGVFRNYQKEKSFTDVDFKRSYFNSKSGVESFELDEQNDFVAPNEAVSEPITTVGEPAALTTSTKEMFVTYFHTISKNLKDKADDADEKASILLDRGIGMTTFGIAFFIFSIISWQFLSYKTGGFKEQYIYGMISCSVLFIFIEFLSAWFLKQYRHFIDTSTYLLKVKAIFDRYLLTFYALNECPVDDASGKTHTKHIFSLLAEEIKWPDKSMVNGKDIGFAKEAMDAMSAVAKTLKSEMSNRKPRKHPDDEE